MGVAQLPLSKRMYGLNGGASGGEGNVPSLSAVRGGGGEEDGSEGGSGEVGGECGEGGGDGGCGEDCEVGGEGEGGGWWLERQSSPNVAPQAELKLSWTPALV
jgi:hypothetical protein